jgi:hypothetical protein
MTRGACVDDGKSAMADTNPVLNIFRIARSLVSLSAASPIIGQDVLMDIPLRIYEGNAFIIRAPVAHSSKASTQLGRIRPMCLKEVISSYSAHWLSTELKQQITLSRTSFPIS